MIQKQRVDVAKPRDQRHEVEPAWERICVDDSGRHVDVVETGSVERAQAPHHGDKDLVFVRVERGALHVQRHCQGYQQGKHDELVVCEEHRDVWPVRRTQGSNNREDP